MLSNVTSSLTTSQRADCWGWWSLQKSMRELIQYNSAIVSQYFFRINLPDTETQITCCMKMSVFTAELPAATASTRTIFKSVSFVPSDCWLNPTWIFCRIFIYTHRRMAITAEDVSLEDIVPISLDFAVVEGELRSVFCSVANRWATEVERNR